MQNLNGKYEVFPVPQEIMEKSEMTRLIEPVCILIQEGVKEATVNKVKNLFKKNQIAYTFTQSLVEGKSHFYLTQSNATNEQIITKLTQQTYERLEKKEGYTLIIDGAECAQIVLVAEDSEGIHWGSVTLGQLLEQCPKEAVRKCVIRDYPEILYRGYIEGFYGFPWRHEDRKDLMAWCSEQKLNSYIYAPKDDPYHRKNWRDLYPNNEANEIAELAQVGHANNLNFIWTIHPGDSIDLISEVDFQSLCDKLEQVYQLGVRQFGILFDDIGGVPNGKEQAEFINKVDRTFVKVKGDIKPLITVGTRYCEAWGPSMKGYFKSFLETLHEDVEVMWTGAATMSNISKEQYDAPKRQAECTKNLSVWWNYPVNDYCDPKLLMGKIQNLNPNLDNVNGFFSNPMNQPQASKQALFCIADYTWNTDAFDSDKSFSASFKALAPEIAQALELFASHSCYLKDDGGVSGEFLFDESWEIRQEVQNLLQALKQKELLPDLSNYLLDYFRKMGVAAEQILSECLNKHLVEEIKPFVEAFKAMAAAGVYALEAVKALEASQLAIMEEKNERAFNALEEMNSCKVHRLKDELPRDFTVEVGTLVIKPFLTQVIELTAIIAGTQQAPLVLNYDMKNIALTTLGVTGEASSYEAEDQHAEQALKGKIAGGKWCTAYSRPYLTIDLKQPHTIKRYRIVNCGHPEAGETNLWNTRHIQLLASQDGENFEQVDEIKDNTADTIEHILFEAVTARYMRLQVVEPTQISQAGEGATRIYAVELFEEAYPEQSLKVLSKTVRQEGYDLIIENVHKGDCISLYCTLEAEKAFAKSVEVVEDQQEVRFKGILKEESLTRVFIERQSKHYLPSPRTSKTIIKHI